MVDDYVRKVDGEEGAKIACLLLVMENERLDKQKQGNLDFIAQLEKRYDLKIEKGSGD